MEAVQPYHKSSVKMVPEHHLSMSSREGAPLESESSQFFRLQEQKSGLVSHHVTPSQREPSEQVHLDALNPSL